MLVSIVISAYNGEKYISRCVESFLQQSYENIEIILIDDASTDNTKKIMYEMQEKNPNKIKVSISEVNNGPGGGKNEGLLRTTGDYVFFCDCDDYVDSQYIAKLVKNAQNNNFPDIVFGGFEKVTDEGNLLYTRNYKNAKEALFQGISDWGKLFKRTYLLEKKLEIPYGKVLEDVMFRAVVICTKPTLSLCNTSGYKYTYNINSVSQTYMKKFIPGVLKEEILYLKNQQTKINDGYKELYIYLVYQIMCWHILKSGSGVGIKQMRIEYSKMKKYLSIYFPEYKNNKYLIYKQPQYVRFSVKFAVKIIFLLDKIGLAYPLLLIYSSYNFDKLWPKM